MIKATKKFFRVSITIFRNAIIRDSKIRGFVIASVATQFLDILTTLILFNVIFANTHTLGGWNFYQALFLYAYFKAIAAMTAIWVRTGNHQLAKDLIRLGDYDFNMTKPFDSMLLTSISKPKIYSSFALIFDICLAVYAVNHAGIAITPVSIVWFIFLTPFALVLFYFLDVISVVPAFWLTRLNAINDFINRMVQFAKYPSGVFPPTLRIILGTILPVIVMSYFPASTLFYPPKISYIIYMVVITFIFGFIARKLWRLGEKNYGSASS